MYVIIITRHRCNIKLYFIKHSIYFIITVTLVKQK